MNCIVQQCVCVCVCVCIYVGASLTLLKIYVIGNKLGGEHSRDYMAKGKSLLLIHKHVT